MVVDVDHEPRALDRLCALGDPALVRTVDGEQDPILEIGRQVAQNLRESRNRYSAGIGSGAREVHDGVFPERAQPERGTEQRAERVAVRVLVPDDDEPLVRAEQSATA